MNHFFSARLKLTLWYLTIVAIVSLAFSGIIYRGVIADLEHGFQMAEHRIRNPGLPIPKRLALEILSEDFENSKRSVLVSLARVNGIIILASGVAAYILAGKTLSPLEEALEEQKRFTADASHELKTPLTALRTEIEVALRDSKLSLKDAKYLLKSNLDEVQNLQKLTENLMLLNRYSQSHNGMHFNLLNSKELVEKAAFKLMPLAKIKKVKINLDLTDTSLKGDAQSLEELFVILLENAIKYSPPRSTVIVSSSLKGRNLQINVKDEGVGIPKVDQEHLFDRFYRADSSRNKTSVAGFGLGLSIAKEIVERHSGSIRIASKVGKGSTFTVVLPS